MSPWELSLICAPTEPAEVVVAAGWSGRRDELQPATVIKANEETSATRMAG